jgi:hypothetical protein
MHEAMPFTTGPQKIQMLGYGRRQNHFIDGLLPTMHGLINNMDTKAMMSRKKIYP